MAWITPITDWTSEDYVNYDDWNRIESNSDELLSLLLTLNGFVPITDPSITDRTYETDFIYADVLNRIETTILAIRNYSSEPINWTTPKTDWIADYYALTEIDLNRIEINLLGLYNLLTGTTFSLIQTGGANSICGQNATYL
jgi:hypothetical protein